ncbi:prolyl oligopeptidase family serine peptidase [Vibrio sp. CDRSL-10 TSBA]
MLKPFLSVAITALCSAPAFAAWQAEHYDDGQFTLPYQLYTPQQHGQLPLIIHLHGSGEAGTDNQAQMYQGTNWGPQYFASAENQAIQPSYVLAPQTPGPMRWASTTLEPYNYKKTPSTESMTALLHLVDSLLVENPDIDPARVYITGLSRGGQGVWNAMMQRPELFAAALPIAGSADPKQAKTINQIPTWVFHGSADEVTNVDYSRQMVDAVIRSGGSTSTIRYTEIEDGGHAASWVTAYGNSDVYRWLMKHHKQ